MDFSLKDFIKIYYDKYQEFYNNSLIKKINNQIHQISCVGLKTLNVKPIKVNYIWNRLDNCLDIDFTACNKKNKILYRYNISIKKDGDDISFGIPFTNFSLGNKITEILEKNKYKIMELLSNYRYVNECDCSSSLKMATLKEDFIAVIREKNYISFVIYKEDKQKASYVETMNTMAGFLRIGNKFGFYLDTGEYFIIEKNFGESTILTGKEINDFLQEKVSNIYITINQDLLNEFLNVSNLVKRRKRK